MSAELFLAHVRALRAECEAILALTESAIPPAPPADPAPAGCDHPDYMRVSTSTLQGPPSFYCRKCQTEVVGR